MEVESQIFKNIRSIINYKLNNYNKQDITLFEYLR